MRRKQGQGFSATEHCTEEDTEEVEWESEVGQFSFTLDVKCVLGFKIEGKEV